MAPIRFKTTQPGVGHVLVDNNVVSGDVTISVTWNDDPTEYDDALGTIEIQGLNGSIYTIPTPGRNGSGSATFQVKGVDHGGRGEFVVLWRLVDGDDSKAVATSDTKIIFYDAKGTDENGVATLSTANVQLQGGAVVEETGPSQCPAVIPWAQLLPKCPSPPALQSVSSGLQITKTGNSQITLNLKNYEGQLVTLKITHQKQSNWKNGFSFSIPQASDIAPDTGGLAYNKSGFSNNDISSTTQWYVYNVDGGNYNYVFNHTSTAGNPPTRTNYTRTSSTSTQNVTSIDSNGNTVVTPTTVVTYTCVPRQETYSGPWPHCSVGVAISKNGGSEVRWVYSDGSGGSSYGDQIITIQVVAVRNVVPIVGQICAQTLKDSLWIKDLGEGKTENVGNCIDDYRSHSSAFLEKRFRNPILRSSMTTMTSPVCFGNLRGFAGAKTPSEWGIPA